MDPTTGTIDMDLIQTGISAADRTLRAQLTQELRSLIQRALLPIPAASLLLIRQGLLFAAGLIYVCARRNGRGWSLPVSRASQRHFRAV